MLSFCPAIYFEFYYRIHVLWGASCGLLTSSTTFSYILPFSSPTGHSAAWETAEQPTSQTSSCLSSDCSMLSSWPAGASVKGRGALLFSAGRSDVGGQPGVWTHVSALQLRNELSEWVWPQERDCVCMKPTGLSANLSNKREANVICKQHVLIKHSIVSGYIVLSNFLHFTTMI